MIDLALYRIEDEIMTVLDTMAMCPDELRPELEERLAQYIGAEINKVDNIGRVLSSLESVRAHAKSEIERLRAREQAAENNARRLEAYILRVLAGRDGRPLKGHYTTLFARRSEAVIIDDPDAVPDQWKRTTLQIDIPKDPLKRAIKDGGIIPGVHIEERQHLVKR